MKKIFISIFVLLISLTSLNAVNNKLTPGEVVITFLQGMNQVELDKLKQTMEEEKYVSIINQMVLHIKEHYKEKTKISLENITNLSMEEKKSVIYEVKSIVLKKELKEMLGAKYKVTSTINETENKVYVSVAIQTKYNGVINIRQEVRKINGVWKIII